MVIETAADIGKDALSGNAMIRGIHVFSFDANGNLLYLFPDNGCYVGYGNRMTEKQFLLRLIRYRFAHKLFENKISSKRMRMSLPNINKDLECSLWDN